MEHRKSRLVKSLVVLMASVLLATAMVNSGVTANESTKVSASGSPTVAAQAAGLQADHTVSVKRLKADTPTGNALLILQFNDKNLSGRRLKIDIDNRPMVFCDECAR